MRRQVAPSYAQRRVFVQRLTMSSGLVHVLPVLPSLETSVPVAPCSPRMSKNKKGYKKRFKS